MAARSYQDAVEEIRAWLTQGRLQHYTDILISQGYDDLASIRRCNRSEMLELLALFRQGNDRLRARRHIDALRGLVRPPASPSSDDTDSESVISSKSEQSVTKSSPSSTTSAHIECAVRIRCPYLYKEPWVNRYFVLNGKQIHCYPDNADQMPEFSIHVANPRTLITQQAPTVISIADRGQHHHFLIDFGRAETLATWLGRLHDIQGVNRPPEEPEPDYGQLLQRGQIFKKIKNTTASRRRIWCSPDFDKIIWGRPDDVHDVCGFIRVASIQHVDIDAGQLRLNIVTARRELLLETTDDTQITTWAAAIRWAHDRRIERQVERDLRLRNKEELHKLRRRKQRCEDLLIAGDVFRKLKHGTGLQRKVACTADMMLLQWKDEAKGRIKGQVAMADIVWVENEGEKRFRIIAKQRVIELEAVDTRTRDLWVEVLKFYILINSEKYEAEAAGTGDD